MILTAFARPTVALLVAAGLSAGTPSIGTAQDTTGTPTARRDTARLQRVEVSGARGSVYLRNASPVPVDVVRVGSFSNLGQPELTQILNYVAPSFESTIQTQADLADHVDFAQLRGLGADQTLVLINGKRRHSSALVHVGDNIGQGTEGIDLNSIPAAAIDHIEILRDGAAAQYGSDAIAGVMNIILKSNTDGGAVSTQAGVTSRSDGVNVRADANYGFTVAKTGFLNLTAEYRERQPTNRVGHWTGNVYFGNLFNFGSFGNNGEYNSQADFDADKAKIAARHFNLDNVQRIGDSQLTNATFFANGAVPVGDSVEAYAFGGLTSRRGDGTAFYRFPADPTVSDTLIFPNGYLPHITSDITDRALTVGVRGTRGAWTVDLSDTYGSNRFGFGVSNTLNASLQNLSTTTFNAGSLDYSQNDARLDVSRFFATADEASSLNLALGTEFRREFYQVTAGDATSYLKLAPDTSVLLGGSQGFPGYSASDATSRTRTNIGGYLDAEATLARRFIIGAAGRYENYSDFGDRVVGKLAGLVHVAGGVSLRAAINSGFRAPSLGQLANDKVSTFFQGNRQIQVGLFNNQSSVVRALGVQPLKPERSVNVSGGIVYDGPAHFQAAVDVYQVKVYDRIEVSGVLDRSANPGIDTTLTRAGFSGVQAIQFFSNAVDTRTRGVDAVASIPLFVGNGVLTLASAANFNTTRIIGPVRTPPGLGSTPLFDPQARSWIEDALPPSKILVSVRYAVGPLSTLLRTTHFGTVRSVNLFGPNEHVTAAFITDANVSYRFDRFVIGAGADNFLDVLAPHQAYANTYFGIFKYSRVVPWGIRGATYYASVTAGL